MSDIFSFLKQHTLSSHQALEAHSPFNQMLQTSEFRAQEYTLMLEVLLAFHKYTQYWLASLPDNQRVLLSVDSVIDSLHQDLQQLQDGQTTSPATFVIDTVAASADARALAAGYVWMGSSLGGKMIERWLRHDFPDLPRAYYTQMKEVSKHWPAFIANIKSAKSYSSAQMAHIADIANALFTGLRDTATRLSHDRSATAEH